MVDVLWILNLIHILTFVITVLCTGLYIVPILIHPRLRHQHNILTVNLCLASLCCISYWLFYFVILQYHPLVITDSRLCNLLDYFELACTVQVPLAMILLALHRLLIIVYPRNRFLQHTYWIMLSVILQWFLAFILALPRLSLHASTVPIPSKSGHRSFFGSLEFECPIALWTEIYALGLVVITPSLICFILNYAIFKHVHSSSNRIHQHQQHHQTSGTSRDTPATISHTPFNRRDLHLVRHMITMSTIFVGGWSPFYLYNIITVSSHTEPWISSVLLFLAELSILVDLINLFIYNHELTRFYQMKLWAMCRK